MKKNLRLSISLFLLLFLPILIFSGCGSNYEPDELSYVLLIGIDHGAENLLRVSYLIAVPKEIAGSGSGGGGGGGKDSLKGSSVTTVESPSLYASMNMVNTYVGRRISLMHAKGIIFSEAMAKDGSMARFIPALTQYRETRGTAFLAVSKEKPEEILARMKPFLETNPAKYMELLAATQSFTGFIPKIQLQQFYNELKVEGINPVSILIAKSDDKLPPYNGQNRYSTEGSYVAGQLIKQGGVTLEAMGSAAFSEGRMVGELNGDETSIYSMFRGTYQRGVYSFEDPLKTGNIVAMDVSQARKPQIKVKLTEQGAVIDARLALEGNVLGVTSTIDYSLTQNRVVLEKAFEDFIKKEAETLIEKTQQEFKSDIFGFGTKARRLVSSQREWQELKWQNLYEYASLNVEVEYNVRRTGNLLRVMPVAKPEQGVPEGSNPQ